MADGIIVFRPDGIVADGPAADASQKPVRDNLVELDSDAEIQLLEAEIAAKRERVVASFSELRRRVDVATDWRGWVRARPMAWVAGAIAVGFIAGSLGSGSRQR